MNMMKDFMHNNEIYFIIEGKIFFTNNRLEVNMEACKSADVVFYKNEHGFYKVIKNRNSTKLNDVMFMTRKGILAAIQKEYDEVHAAMLALPFFGWVLAPTFISEDQEVYMLPFVNRYEQRTFILEVLKNVKANC